MESAGTKAGLRVADLHHPAVDAALATANALLGMDAVFIGGLTEDEFIFERIRGVFDGAREGQRMPRTDSLCHRMVAGAPVYTADAHNDPAYSDTPGLEDFSITTYVGIPLQQDADGVVGTLCGVDRRHVHVSEQQIDVLGELAHVVEAHIVRLDQPIIRRTPNGWQVGDIVESDLLSAMVLADLLSPMPAPTVRPPAEEVLSEADRLRVTVKQLEHALSARVMVEQAIGVIAERHHLQPRPAFERLRRAARSRGRKVQDLAREIVASTSDRGVPVPPELATR